MDLHRFSAFDYMKLVVGSALVAAAFQFFTFPNSIVSGGVTGIAQIIRLLTGIPVGVLSILINIPIFYLGWRHRLGTRRLILAHACGSGCGWRRSPSSGCSSLPARPAAAGTLCQMYGLNDNYLL